MEKSEETYRIEVDKKFIDDLKNVEESTRRRVKELVDILETNPLFVFNLDIKKLKGLENIYRLRIGKYRILLYVDKDNKKIVLLRFLKRKKAYRRST
ncbi:MAG: type II toxin-antitoxin system RelE/ParE family toxin [Candidatus Njordarchaeota archaeon]